MKNDTTKYPSANVTKWFTISEYIDETTGELINKEQFKRYYYVTNKNKKTSIEKNTGYIKIQITGKPRGQYELEL